MFRRTLLACSVVLSLGFFGAAQADTGVNVHYGIRFYNHPVGPNYRYSDNYGWYDFARYPNYRDGYSYPEEDDYVALRPNRLSCGEARRIVRANGYRNVGVRDCDGRTYSFIGTRNGRSFIVYVNSRNGRVWRA